MKQTQKFNFNLDELDEVGVYNALEIEGHEEEALTDSYFELYQLIGAEATLKLYKHFHGYKIDCPMRLYRAEYIADLAKKAASRHERAEISRAAGYSLKFIENILQKRKKEYDEEDVKDHK